MENARKWHCHVRMCGTMSKNDSENEERHCSALSWGANEKWEEPLLKMMEWTEHNVGAANMASAVCTHLDAWRNQTKVETLACEVYHPILELALTQQDEIGWESLLEGCPAQAWSVPQQDHFTQKRSQKTGFKWVQCWTWQMMSITQNMWKHWNSTAHLDGDADHTQLDNFITHHLQRGQEDLPTCHAHHFSWHRANLLACHHTCKLAW